MKEALSIKNRLISALLVLVMMFTSLIGTTFAWFTDEVTSSDNKIQSGNLQVDLSHLYKGEWLSLKENKDHKILNYDKWEPGYTLVDSLKVDNLGSLALKYRLSVEIEPGSAKDGKNGEKLSDVIEVYITYGDTAGDSYSAIKAESSGWTYKGTLTEVLSRPQDFITGQLLPTGGVVPTGAPAHTEVRTQVVKIALHMKESAGNEYQDLSVGDIYVSLLASQLDYENDSFGGGYDGGAEWPESPIGKNSIKAPIGALVDGKLAASMFMQSDDAKTSATFPEGVKADEGATEFVLTFDELAAGQANITLDENEEAIYLNVHVDGVAEDNEIPIAVYRKEVLPKGLNIGNYRLYHVEDGVTVQMTLRQNGATPVHNDFDYDPVTGDAIFYLKSFSEVALVADTENAWKGAFDYSWYTNAVAPVAEGEPDYVIANADQLAAFGAIVGGMKKVTDRVDGVYTYSEEVIQDSFTDKTVKLIADIDLGDKESENNSGIIFYPIGYWNDEGTYEKTGTDISSGFYTFEGTFDGNGNTISNFYQNTWEMKGDHDWYSPEEQYYRDGMGLFGKVYGGTVKNLTVKNFSSDGEITTTGVIASYADGATFENIAIFNCNPRVYNIGNGGIVGCVGWYAKDASLKTTFTNITVDNSNKISALWGSYDVACGGIVGQYYPTSGQTSAGTPKNAGIEFTNCHVAAQMDVYNDVCANYQYYAYRYTGMLIGSIRENLPADANGHVYPNMNGITASGCTVHFGDWNDYYYCELVANSLASYTHDHQMSRLEQVASVDTVNKTVTDLKGNTTDIPTSGRVNYVVVKAKDANGMWIHGDGHDYAECYHFVNGVQHFHDVADSDNPNPTEMVNGVETLKEDKQLIYREFNQLFTGYGWGVTSKGLTDFEGVTNMDITAGDHETSVTKFNGKVNKLTIDREYTIGEIFALIEDCGVEVIDGSVNVTINNLDENGKVKAMFTRGETWDKGTISFENTGNISITITDYYFCSATTITVNIAEPVAVEKFDVIFNNGDFLHRVGNSGTVAIDKLFKAKDGVTVGTISATVEAVDGTGASGTYSNNAIQFNGTGVVKVTITDNDYCIPTELYLEVVDAVNATGATSATSNNVVLLNDISSGFTVSGSYTVYGNGFTLNYTGNGQYLNNGLKQGIVTVSENGTLDNLRIKASIYPTAFMYYGATSLGDYVQQSTNPTEVEGDKTRYYYQLSAVAASGNATISNCYIYGARTNIFVNTGDVTIKDTILECGVVANVQIQSTNAHTVTLENVTTIQYQTNATIGDTSKVMLGTGVLVGPDTVTNPTIVLNGAFKQYNWVTEKNAEAVSAETAKMIINGALNATEYNHTVNGETASNLGIIYMNTEEISIYNKTGLPYVEGVVTLKTAMGQTEGKVYSLQGATENQIYSDYENADRSTVNGDYIPTFDFDLGDQEISYDGSEDTRYMYGDKNGVTALYKDGETALTLVLSRLATIYKYTDKNYEVTVVCKDSNGNTLTESNGIVTLDAQGSYTLEFTVEDNIFYGANGQSVSKSVTRTYTVPLTLTVKAADIKNATVNITKTALDGVYTTVNVTDYKLRINFLDCISITDYDNKGTGTTVDLTSNISSATLTPDSVNVFTTASTVTVTYTDGRVLTVNLSKISGSSPGTKTATVNTSGGLYFITDGALNNKPTESSSQNICTITSVSYKGNSGSTITNDTDVAVTWDLGSNDDGCVTPDTLVTLADGTQKEIQHVTYEDQLLVWDFVKGEYTAMPAIVVRNHGYSDYRVITLYFNDGTTIDVIAEHGFFDVDLNEFVMIGEENVDDYIGHSFVKADGEFTTVTLDSYSVREEYTAAYSILTAIHYNCVLGDMFTLTPNVIGGNYFMPFEVGEDMKFDADKMQADIEKYGLFTYEEFADLVTEEQFYALNAPYVKVAVGKGIITMDDLYKIIEELIPKAE